MKQIPGFLMSHRVTFEPFLGTNAVGDVFGPAVELRCMFGYHTKMVRGPEGEQVSTSSFYITTPDHLPPLNSRVTTPEGSRRKVVSLDRSTWPGMNVPANTKVYLD